MIRVFLFITLVVIITHGKALGDSEFPNLHHVKSGRQGMVYAKSVPSECYGMKGVTKVFVVGSKEDKLVQTFNWFSNPIYLLSTGPGISVVRFGPWMRGRRASAEDFAIGFYLNGKVLKEYTTLDIAGSPENVSWSESHYRVFRSILGYRFTDKNSWVFDVVLIDGTKIVFDTRTGKM